MKVFLEGIGLCGPGLAGWGASRTALADLETYVPAAASVPVSDLLPANERRRTVPIVKIALAVGSEALAHAGRDASTTATVFASSAGDPDTIHSILEALASSQSDISPTRFHNSVHNAPSGYWSIATRSREPTTSLCCHDASFAAGLLEAAVQATVADRAVAIIAYDLPNPAPLDAVRPIASVFGCALVLSPRPGARTLASLDIEMNRGGERAIRMRNPAFEELRTGNPAARSLPLLAALARDAPQTIILDYLAGHGLQVSVTPMSGEAAESDREIVREAG